ncbi:hypothetical protein OsJ_22359 [Oryza sativa Japonica Group]|uniref:Uncharacterized protein n=2 Tax=Oryza TaxID=4527 RepID=A3BEM6_ORYSJ|nr:hypothetical protein OsJ_22359 [Oryza sativa Japonica Group]
MEQRTVGPTNNVLDAIKSLDIWSTNSQAPQVDISEKIAPSLQVCWRGLEHKRDNDDD